MPIVPYLDKLPKLGERVFLAPGAWVTGDVELGDDVSFWFHTVARGDVNFIRIGPRTNIQDGAVLHVNYRTHSLVIGAGVVVGHQAVLHGCTIEDGALIGIAAQVLDGALVAPGHRIPAGYLALGIPARPVRPLTGEEKRRIVDGCERYVQLKEHYRGVVPPAES
jgi:carbonic anhydrase/acetyltransferase-like protein (isoleucine patch superfamily)